MMACCSISLGGQPELGGHLTDGTLDHIPSVTEMVPLLGLEALVAAEPAVEALRWWRSVTRGSP